MQRLLDLWPPRRSGRGQRRPCRPRRLGEAGATTAEYALILTLVVVILIGTLTTLGAVLNDKLQDIIQSIQGA